MILMDSRLTQILSWSNLVKVFLIPWIYSSIHQAEDLTMYAVFFCSTISASELYVTVLFFSFVFSVGRYQAGMVSSFDYCLFSRQPKCTWVLQWVVTLIKLQECRGFHVALANMHHRLLWQLTKGGKTIKITLPIFKTHFIAFQHMLICRCFVV